MGILIVGESKLHFAYCILDPIKNVYYNIDLPSKM